MRSANVSLLEQIYSLLYTPITCLGYQKDIMVVVSLQGQLLVFTNWFARSSAFRVWN